MCAELVRGEGQSRDQLRGPYEGQHSDLDTFSAVEALQQHKLI
jgi:hypothetical protein